MSYRWYTIHWLSCDWDGCATRLSRENCGTIAEARRLAARDGWVYVYRGAAQQRVDLCPAHIADFQAERRGRQVRFQQARGARRRDNAAQRKATPHDQAQRAPVGERTLSP